MFCDIIESNYLILSWIFWPHSCCWVVWKCMDLRRLVWLWKCCQIKKTFGILSRFVNCQIGILPSLFISFDSNTSSNSFQSPLLYEATLFPQSIDHVYSCNLSNVPDTAFFCLISCASILLQLCILLPCWCLLVIVLAPCIILWTVTHCILSAGLYWTHCELPILLEVLAETPLN